jgi:hypothetical protein
MGSKTILINKTDLANHLDSEALILGTTQQRKGELLPAGRRQERYNKLAWESAGMNLLAILVLQTD